MIKATENACLKGHPLDNNWKWSTAKLWLSHVQKNQTNQNNNCTLCPQTAHHYEDIKYGIINCVWHKEKKLSFDNMIYPYIFIIYTIFRCHVSGICINGYHSIVWVSQDGCGNVGMPSRVFPILSIKNCWSGNYHCPLFNPHFSRLRGSILATSSQVI